MEAEQIQVYVHKAFVNQTLWPIKITRTLHRVCGDFVERIDWHGDENIPEVVYMVISLTKDLNSLRAIGPAFPTKDEADRFVFNKPNLQVMLLPVVKEQNDL